MHRLVADEDREQRGGAGALGRGGAAPGRHFDEGVGPALGRGAGQLVDPRGCAPRRSLASAQSASKRSCSKRLSSLATMEPEMGSRVIWPSHMP